MNAGDEPESAEVVRVSTLELFSLIVLGESIVAVGAGARNRPLDAAVVVTSVLGLALTAALWWIYFAGDEERAEASLRATPVERRRG